MTEAFTTHRRLLFDLAYRMLGRVAEAEDIVQEVWLRWQRQDQAEIRAPRAWLVATTTRLCIDQLRSARQTRTDYYGVWLPEPLVADSSRPPDEAAILGDSLTMAFMLMLEHLAPAERAVFLLREVFGHPYADIAGIVGKSEAACRQMVSRAKARLKEGRAATSVPPTGQAERLVQRFLEATATGQLHELLLLLADNAVLYADGGGRVRSALRPIRTADHIARFYVGIRRWLPARPEFRYQPVNGRPGGIMFVAGQLVSVFAFEFDGGRIRTIYAVRNPEKLRHVERSALLPIPGVN